MKKVNQYTLIIVFVILCICAFIDFTSFKNVISNYLLTHEIKEYSSLKIVHTNMLNNEDGKHQLVEAYRSYYKTNMILESYSSSGRQASEISGMMIPIILLLYLLLTIRKKGIVVILFLLLIVPSLVLSNINYGIANKIELNFQKDSKNEQIQRGINRKEEFKKRGQELRRKIQNKSSDQILKEQFNKLREK